SENPPAIASSQGEWRAGERKVIYEFYLKNTKYINNWDLVDTSAGYIVGGFLHNKPKTILTKFAKSKNLWERRIAIIATFYDIYAGKADETFRIAKILLSDEHDLIHKAVGWMLREVGKRCGEEIEEAFLQEHYHSMPRTMLRYAIERFPEKKRQFYLKQTP
ncbi:MAG: DNA alkylation repair protein, partial [Candidatus Magasanikbacteria bacterium]|nr:DNA alkylation repair protein [Candidatus Magasanikbacteria bacterium]